MPTNGTPQSVGRDSRSGRDFREKFVSLSTGVRMEYVEQGRAGGLPVVFLHGVTDSWRSFERVLPLLPANIHACAISARGHGQSSRPETGYRLSDMSRDLRAFMDSMGMIHAAIVGHSMGAMVAQRFALDNPDRVAGLVLMGAFAALDQDEGLEELYRTAIHPLTTPDFSSELSRVSAPTLIVWGDRDIYARRDSQDRLASTIPGARLVVYEGAGHACHWESPAQFTGDLRLFLARVVERRVPPTFSLAPFTARRREPGGASCQQFALSPIRAIAAS